MRAHEVMTSPVITVQPWRPVKEAAQLLIIHDITALPVVDEHDRLVGIVTDADLIHLEEEPDPHTTIIPRRRSRRAVAHSVADVMSRDVEWVSDQADVADVARVMFHARIRSVPVLLDRRVVGIISRRDLLRVLARSDEDIGLQLDDLLEDEIALIGRFHADIDQGVVTLTGPTDRHARRLAGMLARSIPGVVTVRFGKAA